VGFPRPSTQTKTLTRPSTEKPPINSFGGSYWLRGRDPNKKRRVPGKREVVGKLVVIGGTLWNRPQPETVCSRLAWKQEALPLWPTAPPRPLFP